MASVEPKILKKFLSPEEIILLTNYSILKHRINLDFVEEKEKTFIGKPDTTIICDGIMEALCVSKINIIEKETNLKLLPTYSCWRFYTMGADLSKHTDRNACEVSVTCMINSDGTKWPIFVKDKEYHLEVGDALIYPGITEYHWREEFKGDWHAQVFLHYVDQNGPYKDYAFDGRPFFGYGAK
jgi:hypothetical protein